MIDGPVRTSLRPLVVTAVAALAVGLACHCDNPDTEPDTGDVGAAGPSEDSGGPDPPAEIPDDQARLQIIHDAADPQLDGIDVYLGDEPLVQDFEYRTATPYLDVEADDYDVKIAEAGSPGPDDALAEFEEFELQEQTRYLIVASGLLEADDAGDAPADREAEIALHLFEDALEAAADADADELVLFHGATDVGPVDLVADNAMAVATNLGYGRFTDGYLSVPAGVSLFDVLESETDRLLTSRQTPSLGGGQARVGLISSSPETDSSPQLLMYPTPVGGDRLDPVVLSEAARLQFVHNGPDSTTSRADFYADGRLLQEGVAFRGASPFLTIEAGRSMELQVAETGTVGPDDPIATETVEFEPGTAAVAVVDGVLDPGEVPANPDGISTELDVHLRDSARERSRSTGTELLAYHGVLDAPGVSIDVRAGGATERLAEDLGYTEFGDWVSVGTETTATIAVETADGPAGEFDVDLDSLPADAGLLVLSGMLEGEEPGVATVLVGPDGVVAIAGE